MNAIREVKNNEKIEETEIGKREKNIIIHGAEEVGDDPQEIKNEDNQYVKGVLNKLGTTGNPESVIILGTPNERKRRPIKIVFSSNADKMKGN